MQDQGQTAELPTIYAMVMTHGHAKKRKVSWSSSRVETNGRTDTTDLTTDAVCSNALSVSMSQKALS